MMRPDHQDPNALDKMKPWKRYCYHKFTMSSCYGKDETKMRSLEINDMLRIRLREVESNEEIFTSVAWIRAFNINKPIYAELYHEFYSTYEFDEVSANDELKTKKIIKFRLGGRAYNLTLLEFTRRLGLYHADGLEEDGCNVYFEGDLDTITLRDLIDSKGKLILKDPQPGVPRVGIPRPPRASMQDLYNRIGRMEIRQEAIERMEYRQSYHWDRPIRRIHQGRYGVSVPALTKDHKGKKINMPYPEDVNTSY
ncbi:hypothetical protein Tco_1123772 [Tanacetum coccineum]|uniref:Uncharacterized protein n=1 Tax=Tanacetum coccineum TaxID=301880 RepID=A0ABQ5J4B1_9ASTR